MHWSTQPIRGESKLWQSRGIMQLHSSFRFWNKWFLKSLATVQRHRRRQKYLDTLQFFYVLPLLYYIKVRLTVQYRQKGVLADALTWREITLRYLRKTSTFSQQRRSVWALAAPACCPGWSSIYRPGRISFHRISDSCWCAATYGLFSSWDSSWAVKYRDSTFFSIPVVWKGKTYSGTGIKVGGFRDPMYSSSLPGD